MTITRAKYMIFDSAPVNPPDSIFGLIEDFKRDPRPEKINLSVGVYQDEAGQTPVMKCVQEAERILLEKKGSKNYLPIDGSPEFCRLVGELVLGDSLMPTDIYWATAQTPGGTVALRIAGEMLRRVFNVRTIWMSNPTWNNHDQIYEAAGLERRSYLYLDESKTALDFFRLQQSLEATSPGDAILLHTVCHNPTGVDLSKDQWMELSAMIQHRGLIPIFDFAYQGFGDDLQTDSFPIRQYVQTGGEAIICNSFSKNFGLYAERVGGITAVTQTENAAVAMRSQIQATIRTIYSNPPLHGGKVVETILASDELRQLWEHELGEIRQRIQDLRNQFAEKLEALIGGKSFDYIRQQRGMFSFSGLTPPQVVRLRDEWGIYALISGRINIAGINHSNLEKICTAIAQVM